MGLKDWQKPCPACGAEIGYPCTTGSGKKVNEPHQARVTGVANKRNKLRPGARHGTS